jgi:hypothetical protein
MDNKLRIPVHVVMKLRLLTSRKQALELHAQALAADARALQVEMIAEMRDAGVPPDQGVELGDGPDMGVIRPGKPPAPPAPRGDEPS